MSCIHQRRLQFSKIKDVHDFEGKNGQKSVLTPTSKAPLAIAGPYKVRSGSEMFQGLRRIFSHVGIFLRGGWGWVFFEGDPYVTYRVPKCVSDD